MTADRSKGSLFRSLHERDGVLVVPNPWDVGSARVLANLGFEALATTSAGHAYSLGLPEGTVPDAEVLAHCRAISHATELPVSADLEKGFGDSPDSVIKTIQAAAETGLAGCSIEDHTGRRDDPIFEFGLAVERIEAAVDAVRSLPHDFVLTARCENLRWGHPDLSDTIRRLQAYERAGADVLYAPALPDLESVRTVCASVSRPVNVLVGLSGRTFSVAELARVGVKRISVGSALARLSFAALIDAAREISEQGTFHFASNAVGFSELEDHFRGRSST